jgi:hypothetical protein
MKHKIDVGESLNVNVDVDIPTADVIEIIEAVKNAALTIVAAATAAHILKQFFGKESV